MKMETIRVGSRESKLALIQTNIITDMIRKKNPQLEFEIITVKTAGDRLLDRRLDSEGGKGLFVKELDRLLLDGDADFCVHSLKDMPAGSDDDLPIYAFSPRADVRDALVLAENRTDIDFSLPFGSSSPRRIIQLKKLYENLDIKMIRGNVISRIAKVEAGDFGGTVLAMAGLERLEMTKYAKKIYSAEEIIPAAGQGIIAVQGRADKDYHYLKDISDISSFYAASAERAFILANGAGCSSPVAAYARVHGNEMKLDGLYAQDENEDFVRGSISGNAEDACMLGERLAEKLRKELQV